MARYKQIVWSVITITAWLSFMSSLWLAELGYINYWFGIYWGITLILSLMFGIEKK